MNRTIYSLLALTLFALPAGAADSVKTEGGLPPKDASSSTIQAGSTTSVTTPASSLASPDLSSPGGTMSSSTNGGSAPLRGPAQAEPMTTQGLSTPIQVVPNATLSTTDSLASQAAQAALAMPTGKAHTHHQELSANYSTVSASAKLLKLPPLMRCRDENLQFVEITLRNDSPEVALVHGDIAEARVGSSMRTAASARYIGTVASPKLNTKGRVYTGLLEAGSWGLAGPIFYELVTPDQHRKRYKGTAIGVDGSRHEIEDQRFGLRVLMPGEETVGWLAFECPESSSLTSLLIPVNYSRSQLPSGSLMVKVAAADVDVPAGATVGQTSTNHSKTTTTTSSSTAGAVSLPGRIVPPAQGSAPATTGANPATNGAIPALR